VPLSLRLAAVSMLQIAIVYISEGVGKLTEMRRKTFLHCLLLTN